MPTSNVAILGVAGTDGIVPVYNPNGIWQWWGINDVYQGQAGSNKYIPKLNDYVIDPINYTTYIVTALDPVTLVPTLTPIIPSFIPNSFTPSDVLFGVGPGTQADTYRVYLDTSVTPFVMSVDVRLYVGGTKAAYCKIFQGADVSGTGTVVSMVYNASGTFITQNVPLELVAINGVTNYSWQTIAVCNSSATMNDGEIVTCVIYDAQGGVVSKRQLLVENTSFIRSVNISQKYITSIALLSPFINSGTPNSISFPLNLPVTALNLIGVVNYSDGSSVKMPVDGVKFNIIGLNQYVSTIVGQILPLVLSYQLGTGEVTYSSLNSNGKYVTAPYSIETTNPNNSYDVKIFGYPEWSNISNSYSMRFFMTTIDRTVFFDVTNYVTFATNTGLFNPTAYGYLQRKAIQLNLSKVAATYQPFIATQLMDINLLQAPVLSQTAWTMAQVSGTDVPPYGTAIWAKISSLTNYSVIDISGGLPDITTWLNDVYLATHPLVNPYNETAPLPPTHFVLMYGGNEYTYSISNWNSPITIAGVFTNFSNVYLRFISVSSNATMILSIAGMIIYQIS